MINRRTVLAAGGAFAAAALAPRSVWAEATLSMGERSVTTLRDGSLSLPASFMFGPTDQAALPGVLAPYGLSAEGMLTPPCNVTLLREPGRVVLFDAGAGSGFQPGVGGLVDALDAAGLSPEDVTHVVFTHGHPDHLWGVLDDFDEPLFLNAEHMMGRVEFEYWMRDDAAEDLGEERAAFAIGAKRRLDVLADAITLFEDGDEVLPGVAARMTPGHTPGHMAFELRSGGEGAMITGDAIGNHHVAFAKPEWRSGSDQDYDLAIETRVRLIDQLATDGLTMIGFHLPDGGMGRVERADGAYRFAPIDA